MPLRVSLSAGRRELPLVAVTVLLAALLGCGESGVPLGDVSGVVTYDGKPLADAEVEFFPLGKGKSSIGFTSENGEYRLQYTLSRTGALLGKHRVSVRAYPPPGAPAVSIPSKYGANSELICEVTSGANTFDIKIESAD